jgi:hypothetical protein
VRLTDFYAVAIDVVCAQRVVGLEATTLDLRVTTIDRAVDIVVALTVVGTGSTDIRPGVRRFDDVRPRIAARASTRFGSRVLCDERTRRRRVTAPNDKPGRYPQPTKHRAHHSVNLA